MGLQATCEVRHGRQAATVQAHLDTATLELRGPLRLDIPFSSVKAAEARNGALRIEWTGGATTLALGPDAETWALKIRYPKGRIDKIGVKPQQRVAVVGLDAPDFLDELRARTGEVTVGRPKKETDVVVVQMTAKRDLPRLTSLRAAIRKDGMIWVVWPKGRKELREDDVRAYGKTAGLVDVKVMSFSDVLSGLKLVIPKKDR
jgi:hypothetical protein